MVRVVRSTIIAAPVVNVWRLLRDFNSHDAWHPAVVESRIEDGRPSDEVGAVRAFRLQDGSFLREQLIAISDQDRSLSYCILEAPLPLIDYVATMRLRPVTDGDLTFLHWESSFAPPPARAAEMARLVGEDIYEGGMAALKQHFGAAATR